MVLGKVLAGRPLSGWSGSCTGDAPAPRQSSEGGQDLGVDQKEPTRTLQMVPSRVRPRSARVQHRHWCSSSSGLIFAFIFDLFDLGN